MTSTDMAMDAAAYSLEVEQQAREAMRRSERDVGTFKGSQTEQSSCSWTVVLPYCMNACMHVLAAFWIVDAVIQTTCHTMIPRCPQKILAGPRKRSA